jgi:threonine/homoserine efflux transporter RhtA
MIVVLLILVVFLLAGPSIAKALFAPYTPATYLLLWLALLGLVLMIFGIG